MKLFPAVAVGMIPGAFVLAGLSNTQFKAFLGILILILLAGEGARRKFGLEDVPHRWWFTLGAGILAGFSTLIGNAAGPVMTIYLFAQGFDKHRFMGTWVWFFLIVNTTKLPILARLDLINFQTLGFSATIAGMVVVGALVGRRVFHLIPQKVFDPLVLGLTGLAAVVDGGGVGGRWHVPEPPAMGVVGGWQSSFTTPFVPQGRATLSFLRTG